MEKSSQIILTKDEKYLKRTSFSPPPPNPTHTHTQCLHFKTRKKALDWKSLPLNLDKVLMKDQ